ncbi:MAG TPA: ABC transporter permease [Candidatus Sulfotelmatobacter sp.]|nr:ABC transporter permease [Candidatus Sulfotelmatobacter sp.]HWI65036.1 ABC transporter permease [Symbiobacteriaceae bacterium]
MWNRIDRRTLGIRAIQLVLMVGVLAAWEMRARTSKIFGFFFSQPSRIADRIWKWLTVNDLHLAAAETLGETLAGFAIGVGIGLTLALVCYYSPVIFQVIEPVVNIANAMPRVVFGPLFILWFGLGMMSKVMLAASLVLFIVFFATLAGLKEVDRNVTLKVKLMGASPLQMLAHVLLPSALTWLFSSLRTSVGFALAGAVVGEYVGAGKGLGYHIAFAEGNLDSTGVFAGLLVLAFIVLALNAILERVERRLTPWRATA